MLEVVRLSDREKRIRAKLKKDFKHYALRCLKIRQKDGSVVSFVMNRAQNYIHERLEAQLGKTGKVRALILKGRQQGCSTYVGGRFYHKTTHSFGIQTFILTHALDATANLYKMAQRFHENCPELVRPKVSTNNSKELIFGDLDSGYKIGTAENKSVGRSSTIQLFHGSETAFWNNASEHAMGIMQAVPDAAGTEVILESTANGVGGYFHQMWQMAESSLSEYEAIFVPWYWQDEYRKTIAHDQEFKPTAEELELIALYQLDNEQLNWRREKILQLSVNGANGEKSFRQEYPNNSTEAFQLTGDDSYIQSEEVYRARKGLSEKYGPLIVGVDPARFGNDRTSIIRRQGRCAFDLESYAKKDTMEIVGIVNQIILSEKPAKVFIDIGGLGAGIVDRLHELGHNKLVVGVNAGSKPLNGNRFYNKRAEMWAELKAWLNDYPVQIPDSDSLHADLCALKYTFDSTSRLKIESKEDAKKRGIRSPDEADALCLTFAFPVIVGESIDDKSSLVAKKLNSVLKSQLNARNAGGVYGA